MGEHVGVDGSTISDYENCESVPTLLTLVAIADLFGVSGDYLLGRTDAESGLPPNCWLVDLDWLEALRRGEDPSEAYGEFGAVAIPRRQRVFSSVEYQQLQREVEQLKRKLRRSSR